MTDSQHPIRLAEEPLTDRHKLGWGLAALVVAGNMIGSGVSLLPVSLAAVGILVGLHRQSHARVTQEFPLTRQTRLAVRL